VTFSRKLQIFLTPCILQPTDGVLLGIWYRRSGSVKLERWGYRAEKEVGQYLQPYGYQWYFSNDNNNENILTVVNGNENENDIDFQNEKYIKIKMMSCKTYKNENVYKENEKTTWMITISKTIRHSLCLYNGTLPCIYWRSHARFSVESDLNRLLNTCNPIIRIHISRSASPVDTLCYWR